MSKQYSLKQLAEISGSTLRGDPDYLISGVSAIDNAESSDATFIGNARYAMQLTTTKAGVICIAKDISLTEGKNFLICEEPTLTFQAIVEAFIPKSARQSGFKGVHQSAILHPTASIAEGVQIGPGVVIDQGVTIGANTQIMANVSIGPGVQIGEDCLLYPNVAVREGCLLGSRVVLQPGAVIGSCGFGYHMDKMGRHQKLAQVGIVELQDDVEIGANSTIDRARFHKTIVAQGTKIDNLVQIGHNVELGPHNIIVAQVGIAGSTKTGRHVVIGGQTAVAGHIELEDETMVAARSGVIKSLKKGKYAGAPAIPAREHHRNLMKLMNISKYIDQVKALETRIKELESSINLK